MRAFTVLLLALVACIDVEPAPRPGSGTQSPQLPSCQVGQLLARGATSWICVNPPTAGSIDATKTPVLTGCTTGQVITWNGDGWRCSNPVAAIDPTKTPVLSGCATGQVISWTGDAWSCADPPAGVDATKTPVVTGCAPGQYVTKTAAGWGCATPTDTHLDSRVSALESEVQSITSSSYVTKTAEATNVAPGACVSLVHGLHATNVGYAGWMSVPGTSDWIPAAPLDGEPTDLALGGALQAQYTDSTGSSVFWPTNGTTRDGEWRSSGNATDAWWQVDLGAVKALGSLRVTTQAVDRGSSDGTTGWSVYASNTTTFGATPIATGTCSWDLGESNWISSTTSCSAPVVRVLPAGTEARYLRFVTTRASGSDASLAELEVYPPRNPFVHVSDDELDLCNVTSTARDLKLRVWQ